MNDQENQLIREVTGQNRDFVETEPEEPNESNETGDEQGETLTRQRLKQEEIELYLWLQSLPERKPNEK